jgi:hypothetical protein
MSSVSSITGAMQNGVQQLKLQMAKRGAAQAEQAAQALQVRANEAQRVADRANENAQNMAVRSDEADFRAGQARLGVATVQSAQQSMTLLAQTMSRMQGFEQSSAQGTNSAPVVNAQGQLTGTTINTTA